MKIISNKNVLKTNKNKKIYIDQQLKKERDFLTVTTEKWMQVSVQ